MQASFGNPYFEIIQEQSYYPFGLQHNPNTLIGTPNKYQYNGKEFNDELGLNYLDYHARNYDPIIGRFNSVDPHAENYTPLSPYVYCANSPIIYVDPDGRDFYYSTNGDYLGKDNKETQNVYVSKEGTYRKCDDGNYKMANTGLTQLKLGDGTAVTHDQFKDLAGTVMGEMDKKEYTANEAAGIYSVFENRAKTEGNNEYDQAQTGGVYGYKIKDNIDKKDYAAKAKVAREGMMKAMTNSTDYSNGAYFWQGRDFYLDGYNANSNYYDVGFKFTDPNHDFKGLGDKVSGKKAYDYVYNSTGFEGRTTFMKYDDKWKKSQKHVNNYP